MNLSGVFALLNLLLLSSPTPAVLSPPSLPLRHQIAKVPYLRQKREHCGPATLAMVFGYYNVRIPQEELAGEIFRENLSGALNLDMLVSARRHGFDAQALEGSPRLLKEYIARNVPVIVLVGKSGSPDQNHFMVIYGYNDEKNIFYIHSGKARAGTIEYPELVRVWEPTGNWMLVVEQKQNFKP